MSGWEWFVIGWLALSGACVFVRGVAGVVREYTMLDALFGVAEIGFLIWVVAVKL